MAEMDRRIFRALEILQHHHDSFDKSMGCIVPPEVRAYQSEIREAMSGLREIEKQAKEHRLVTAAREASDIAKREGLGSLDPFDIEQYQGN